MGVDGVVAVVEVDGGVYREGGGMKVSWVNSGN